MYFMQGGKKMKYEKPEMDVLQLDLDDIVCNSQVTGEIEGSGDLNDPNAPEIWE